MDEVKQRLAGERVGIAQAAATALLIGLAGCRHAPPSHQTIAVKRPAPVLKPAIPIPSVAPLAVRAPDPDFAGVQAHVPSYTVGPSLAEVSNLKSFDRALPVSANQRAMLARNLIACSLTSAQQLFHLYEQNDYLNLPSFVTTDLVLQVYHVFYDFSLRTVETQSLMPILKRLTRGMLADSIATWNQAQDPGVKRAALKNVAFFGVAAQALGLPSDLPPEAAGIVHQETALLDGHAVFAVGAIFPYKIDYSQFVPRGHYTRSDALKRFFRAMTWYGLAPFALRYYDAQDKTVRADDAIRQGLLLTRSLYRRHLDGDWQAIYEPTAFYVGASDDLTPAEWKTATDKVFGSDAPLSAFAAGAALDRFVAAAEMLRTAAIQPKIGRTTGIPKGAPHMIEPPVPVGAQLRFMGQRDLPDSEILQRLSEPIKRVFPSGLDVMAVLGSSRAAAILDANPTVYNSGGWQEYGRERAALTAQFAQLPQQRWTSNLYWSWLHALQGLLEPLPPGFPAFMRTQAWQDKSLNTSLASWAELRHDTILYGKQSAVECGGDDKPILSGYVEPNLVFYDRLLKLTQQSRDGLNRRGILPAALKDKFGEFDDLLTLLKRLSTKELANQKLTDEENQQIRYIGGQIEHLTMSVMEGNPNFWNLVDEADRDMANVADVHTGFDKVLEEGVGHPYAMLVIVPVGGKLVLTRGAILSAYEFKQPIGDRLTDEHWQLLIKTNQVPAPPVWEKSFLLPGAPPRLKPGELESYDSGC